MSAQAKHNTFGLTLTFKAKYHDCTPSYLFKRTLPRICFYLAPVCSKFSIVPELTEKGNLHYHLKVTVRDRVKFRIFYKYWENNYGYGCITPFDNPKFDEKTRYMKAVTVRGRKVLDDSKVDIDVYVSPSKIQMMYMIPYNNIRWTEYMKKEHPATAQELSGVRFKYAQFIDELNYQEFISKMMKKWRKRQRNAFEAALRDEDKIYAHYGYYYKSPIDKLL